MAVGSVFVRLGVTNLMCSGKKPQKRVIKRFLAVSGRMACRSSIYFVEGSRWLPVAIACIFPKIRQKSKGKSEPLLGFLNFSRLKNFMNLRRAKK